jgi:hypothetical protein
MALIYSSTVRYTSLLENPDPNAKGIASAHRADSVEVLEYNGGPYCKVRIPPGQLATDGYLPIGLFQYDSLMVAFVNETNVNTGGTNRLKYVVPPQFIRDRATTTTYYPSPSSTTQSTKSTQSSASTNTAQSYSSGTTSSHTVHTGPRGGKYYINKNGKKTYIKK